MEHQCTAGTGAVMFVNHEISEADLLNVSDKATDQAKQSGRERICFYRQQGWRF